MDAEQISWHELYVCVCMWYWTAGVRIDHFLFLYFLVAVGEGREFELG